MSKKEKKTKAKRVRGGALFALALLLVGSAVLRIGLEAGPAIAREVAGLQKHEMAEEGHEAMMERSSEPSSAELQTMLMAFKEREALLVKQETEIQDRKKALELADQAIEQKLVALEAAEAKLRATVALADGATEADVDRLTTVYEQMKPKDSAALFEEMDPTFAAGFLARMRPDAAAGVMAGLSPEAAYTISVVLAGRNGSVPTE